MFGHAAVPELLTIFSREDGSPSFSLAASAGRVEGEAVLGGTFPKRANPMIDKRKLAADLQREGFSHTYIWADGPNTHYPEHMHADKSAHIILSSEMTLTIDGKSHVYRARERCDVATGANHSARMGHLGCRYLILPLVKFWISFGLARRTLVLLC